MPKDAPKEFPEDTKDVPEESEDMTVDIPKHRVKANHSLLDTHQVTALALADTAFAFASS